MLFDFILTVALSSAPVEVTSQANPEEENLLQAMTELESQLDLTVVSITKQEQRASHAPAVISVVTGEEIQSRGYTSIAEVLRTVPGFYDVYDLSFHNVGVRGVNGGARANGNVIKLMIDGQAVNFRPTTGNFFGEELVPMAAIERVEIIRGPASALYGANAFLGVINVITRSGKQVGGANTTARGGAVRANVGGGGGVLLGGGTDSADVMVAVEASYLNRSGLFVAPSSPNLSRSDSDISSRGLSQGDLSRPKTVLARASIGSVSERGKLSALATVQAPDVGGEFQDYSPLSHGTRLSLVNQTYRLSYDLAPSDKVTLHASGTWFDSAPAGNEQIDLNLASSVLKRNFKANGFEVALEGQYSPLSNLSLSLGTDYVYENQQLLTYSERFSNNVIGANGAILEAAGAVVPLTTSAKKDFQNVGTYAQGIWDVSSSVSLTAGARLDRHNIYGVQFNPRVGLVYSPDRPYYVKALFGTSFKAPSAEQLYTQPIQVFDIRGNAQLSAQRAQTAELAGGWHFGNRGELSANLFFTRLQGRVEFVQVGLYQTAQNLKDESYLGGEAEGRVRLGPWAQTRLGVGVAKAVASSTRGSSIGAIRVDQPLYPVLQTHLITDFTIPRLDVRISPEISYVGPRPTSQSNALISGKAYQLNPYVLISGSVSTGPRKFFGDRETRLTLRATNILGTGYTDPGFYGIDVPALGRSVFLTWIQQL